MIHFKLTLIRQWAVFKPSHFSGETECNRSRIIQGQLDTELSEKGIAQASKVGERLQTEDFSHAYSSDLKRAYQTCEHLLKENNTFKGTIRKDSRLRERRFGVYEGRPVAEFQKAAKQHKQGNGKGVFIPENGEGADEVRARAVSFWNEIFAEMVTNRDKQKSRLFSISSSPECSPPTAVTWPQPPPPSCLAFSDHSESSSSPQDSGLSLEAGRCQEARDVIDSTFARMSSIGSGGCDSSFDESDFVLGNILVVSHGGFLVELIAHLFKVTGCGTPLGGGRSFQQTPPNTSVTRFCVNIPDQGEEVTAICPLLHDTDHLQSYAVAPLTRSGET